MARTAASPGSTESKARRYGETGPRSAPIAATPRSIFAAMAASPSLSSTPNQPPEQVDQRMEGHGLSEREAVALVPVAGGADPAAELEEQARLPDARLAHDEYHLPLAGRARAKASSSWPSSRSRPTSGVSPRSTSTSRRVRASRAVTTSQAGIGSALPFTACSPSARVSK